MAGPVSCRTPFPSSPLLALLLEWWSPDSTRVGFPRRPGPAMWTGAAGKRSLKWVWSGPRAGLCLPLH